MLRRLAAAVIMEMSWILDHGRSIVMEQLRIIEKLSDGEYRAESGYLVNKTFTTQLRGLLQEVG